MTTAANYTEVAQQLYLAYFGRPADPAGLTNLTAALLAGGAPTSIAGFKDAYASGGIVKTVLDSFGTSAESNALYTGTDSQFISAVYQHMLGRDPLLSGLQFWTNALRNHEMSRAEAAVQIMAAAVKPDANAADAATVAHRVTMATLFTAALDTPTEIAFYQGSAVAQEVRDLISAYSGSYDPVSLGAYISQYLDQRTQPTPMGVILTLQHGPDVATGGAGNDTINAPSDAAGGDTLEAQDSVDGALGTDTMNLATQGVVAGGAAVKNVETVNLSSGHAITSADLSGWTGLTKLNISGSGAIGGVVVAAGTDVNVSAGHGNISLSGGHNVVLSTNGGNLVVGLGTAASGSVAAFNTTAGGTTSVDTSGFATVVSTDGAVTISDTTGFIVSAGASVALADRSAHAAALASASAASAAALADTDAAGVAKLAAAAAVNTLAALAGDIAVATNVSADASTALSVQKATTAAFHAGAITAAQKIALDGAFGAALPTSQAAAAAAAQALLTPIQAAADKASAAAIAADVANDGAANGALGAANAAVSADQTAAAAAAGVVVTATSNTALATATVNGNFGAVGNAITDTSAHHDTLTAVTLNNAGATTITGQAMVNLSASDMVDDVTIVNATGGHSTALALSGIAGGLYTDDHAARLTIAADGSAQNVLRGLHAGAATAIAVTGAGGLDFGTLDVAAGAVINATASSGNNAVSVAAGLSYLGGAGADTVTTGAVAQTAAVSGGAGGADKLILTSSANAAAAPAALFAGFEVLQVNSGVVANVANFTASTFSSVVLSGDAEVDGLNATEATHVALTGGAQAIVLGVSGATTPGQLDS
ncbi:MAG TPA: DUF4214 domain-containing protein, partial [Burkholderiaceae bacterium]|nr:DUF4214 domain-containing protein [Burkholderiaceae bacterium]